MRGILQYLHALDVVLVEEVDVGTYRHTIYNVERV
mgnify:CR=1 FL=1